MTREMHPSVDLLVTLMRPPSQPVGSTVDWEVARESWGVNFPRDYRDFLAAYGGGSIDDYFLVATVLDSPDHDETTLVGLTSVARSLAQEQGNWSYRVWPEEGGLICWGATVDGEALYWDTADADPDRWPVVVRGDDRKFTEYEYGMAEFIVKMLGPSAERPLESPTLYGAPNSRYLSKAEERRLENEGVDPWEYLQELFEANEADGYDGDDGLLVVMQPDGTLEYIPGGDIPER
ncbi:SMI1/KNR4 family protein [Streptomyces sp. NPDC021020]|uniref:SMI1/KNR4 family protein n=1 Tax=Streptomyces sp. NPDC021020 TaxID=3365109 RepID=UPI0037B4F848